MIVTAEAYDELLERVSQIDGHERADEYGHEEVELRRSRFALAVERAVETVVTKKDGRICHTQTLGRYGCRLHFVRRNGRIHLIACLALDDDQE